MINGMPCLGVNNVTPPAVRERLSENFLWLDNPPHEMNRLYERSQVAHVVRIQQ